MHSVQFPKQMHQIRQGSCNSEKNKNGKLRACEFWLHGCHDSTKLNVMHDCVAIRLRCDAPGPFIRAGDAFCCSSVTHTLPHSSSRYPPYTNRQWRGGLVRRNPTVFTWATLDVASRGKLHIQASVLQVLETPLERFASILSVRSL